MVRPCPVDPFDPHNDTRVFEGLPHLVHGFEVPIRLYVLEHAGIAFDGGIKDVVGMPDIGICVVMAEAFVHPSREGRRQLHELAIIELPVVDLVDGAGNQRREACGPF